MIEESVYLDSFVPKAFPLDTAPSVDTELADIPRGNTCPGVNRLIIGRLAKRFGRKYFRILDAPCGTGVFLDALSRVLPAAEVHGCDLVKPGPQSRFIYSRANLENARSASFDTKFDAITCISGVMEFDNTLSFFKKLRQSITPDGVLFLTNDNLLTVRDRLMYLLQGRFGQYPFNTDAGTPTWKIVPLQNL
ncbi:MAG: class I SAM-dependent methyltransferase, partial [Acidobacteria bacterium]|nr:class I SAM-dependent methyltransferase [Acidobacteriota bacterium]